MEYIPLERPIADLELKIDGLQRLATAKAMNLDVEIDELSRKARVLRDEIFSNLTPYEMVQLSAPKETYLLGIDAAYLF